MKKRFAILALAIATAFGTAAVLPASTISAEAAELTVSGTIQSGSTNKLIYLSTSGGTMQIKLDSTTTVTGGKLLLAGKKVTVALTRGSDEYWHATSITNQSSTTTVSVDSSKTATISGKILSGSTDEILKLELPEGNMLLKLDDTTDYSGVSMIAIGQTITATVARGTDAYMHAISIVDGSTAASTSSAVESVIRNGVTLPNVSGTVNSVTGRSTLYLKMADDSGVMTIKLDGDTDTDSCPTLLDDQSVTVAVYRGDDAYMHAAKITDTTSKSGSGATLGSESVTVSGTVASGTTPSLLYLSTSGGTMQIKLDASPNMNHTVLRQGYKYSVTVVGGTDGYLHATNISAQ